MPIKYPAGLPRGLKQGRSYQLVSPLKRSNLVTGRAIQRRGFTSVPEGASISWIFSTVQARAFISWWRDALLDGSQWFEMPLDHPALGLTDYTARFTDVYRGPARVGQDLWSITAELELRERAILPPDWGLFPEYILQSDIFDLAINREWPLHSGSQIADEAGAVLLTEDNYTIVEE